MLNLNLSDSETLQEVQKLRAEMHRLEILRWKQDEVFTWQWWLLAALTVIPLILWWLAVDKKRAYEIAFYGSMIDLMALLLDNFGTNLLWWSYPIKLLPILPPLITADSVLVPIFLMMVYQYFSVTWKSHWIANLIAAAFLAFIAEPIFIWIGYYKLSGWMLVYSFLFYNASTTLAKLIIRGFARSAATPPEAR
ncbi:CBO0543 family protein [Cohnella zeiphila]|uniref:CBO0543 family protein n=1 Tax=Cohnella zeiphila TaxID=2761120 RepID=UPI001EE30C30|nr:CBO0543 family protein [Cohnella zeiphila]